MEWVEFLRLRQLFTREPELIPALVEGAAALEPHRRAEVAAAARAACRDRPEFADLHCHAAQASLLAGEVAEARALIRSALEINPRYVNALYCAARVEMSGENHALAAELLQHTVAAGGSYADVFVALGECLTRMNDCTGAAEAFRRALAINPQLTTARDGLAALSQNDDTRGAVRTDETEGNVK